MKKTHKLLAIFMAILILAVPFITSCDIVSNNTEDDTLAEDSADKTSKYYKLIYESNGDGTCSVKIENNVNNKKEYTVSIPEKSPEGDTVTKIASSDFTAFETVPTVMSKNAFEKLFNSMVEKIDEIEDKKTAYEADFHINSKFASYYTLYDISEIRSDAQKQSLLEKYPVLEATPIYVCDPTATLEEYRLIEDIISMYADFSEKDNYQASKELIEIAEQAGVEHNLMPVNFAGNIVGIELPNTITDISDNAFKNCISITSFEIPENVRSIGKAAFANCIGLTSITIPDNVKSIDNNAFDYCINLENVEISESVTKIGDYAFKSCKSFTRIEIPNGVTSVGEGAFEDCNNLEAVVIPKSVAAMGANVFVNCTKVTVYCKADSEPNGWDENWSSANGVDFFSVKVVWGYNE